MSRLPHCTMIGAALAVALAAVADEKPPQSPYPQSPNIALAPTTQQAEAAEISYIGVATSASPPALCAQLQLPPGVGLVVEFIERNSPAETAGLKPHDVIHKFNEQIIVNGQQLSVLVGLHRPGEQVRLGIVRGGEFREINVTLASRRKPAQLQTDLDKTGTVMGLSNHVIKHIDAEHEIMIVAGGEASTITVKDRKGNVLFRDQVDEEADLERLPEPLRQKVINLSKKIETFRRSPPTTAPQS